MIQVITFSPVRAKAIFYKAILPLVFLLSFILQSCKKEKKVFQSNCNDGTGYKRVGFKELIDNIQKYDHQFIEVVGTYKEGDGESALINDSTFVDHSTQHSLWVNFSQECPLYMVGTRKGLFEYNDGKFTVINNKSIIIRGKIDVRHKGHLGSYKGSIDRVSYIKL